MKLNELSPKAGSTKNRMRVGRGIGSGKGKTAGRGVKGQKSRTGVSINGFEGGQMPLYMRLPKFGFNNIFAKKWVEVSLADLQNAIDSKKLDNKKPIQEMDLVQAGVIRRMKDGVRVLGTGELKAKLDLTMSGATKSARAAIEKAGGKLTILDHSAKGPQEKGKGEAAKKAKVKRDADLKARAGKEKKAAPKAAKK